ncbi:hypothetical protein AB4154_00690 [Vibrio sp. 10N.286.51.B11]|uniref:hypothetical protein n=1 Tax=Vibrio sp. 10N.286.51.B11 TaxID=3229706 RepID=UPI0035531C57
MSKQTYIDINPSKVTASEVHAQKDGVAKETSIEITQFVEDEIFLEYEDELFEFLKSPPSYLAPEHRFYIQILNNLVKRAPDKKARFGRPEKLLSDSTFVWAICVLLGSKKKAQQALGIDTKAVRVHIKKLDELGISPFPDREFCHNDAIGKASVTIEFHAIRVAKAYEEGLQASTIIDGSSTLTEIRNDYMNTKNQEYLAKYQTLYKDLIRKQ